MKEISEEIAKDIVNANFGNMYTTIKTLQHIPKTMINIVKDTYGNILYDNEALSKRWKEYLYLGKEIRRKPKMSNLKN